MDRYLVGILKRNAFLEATQRPYRGMASSSRPSGYQTPVADDFNWMTVIILRQQLSVRTTYFLKTFNIGYSNVSNLQLGFT